MAGNKLTIGARFKPMSYAEMIAPVQGANMEYKTLQDELDKLNQASSVWENMANKDTDPLAYQKYTNYATSLKQQADLLASQGLTPNTRKAISQMKGQYQSDIIPIELAYKLRAQMAEQYNKALQQNPTLMSNINPSKLSLDKLMSNPSLTPEYYSGNLLAEQVSSQAKTLASQLRESGQWKSTAGGQMLERIEKYGLSPQDVQLVQSGQGPKELQDLVNNVIKTSPIGKWENADELLPRAYQYAASGLYAGIGKEDIKTGQDQSYITPELRYRMKKDAEAAALEKAKLKAANGGRPLSWETLGSTVDATKSGQVNKLNSYVTELEKLSKGDTLAKLLKQRQEHPTKKGEISMTDMYLRNAYGSSSNLRDTSLDQYDALVSKYHTKDPKELLKKVQDEIKRTTSVYRESVIKTLDNTNLNNLLLDQLSVSNKGKKDLIKTSKGRSLKEDEIAEVFNTHGRLTYSPEKKELGMINARHAKDTRFVLDKNVVANIDIPRGVNAKGLRVVLSGMEYLNDIDRIYANDPQDPRLTLMLGNFYDAIDSYSKTFNQSAPTSNSKEIINETE